MAYLPIADEFNTCNLVYRSVRYSGFHSEEAARTYCEALIEHIRRSLQSFHPAEILLIFWRHRPDFQIERKKWRFYFRLVTSPPLPTSIWHQFEALEGQPARSAKELSKWLGK